MFSLILILAASITEQAPKVYRSPTVLPVMVKNAFSRAFGFAVKELRVSDRNPRLGDTMFYQADGVFKDRIWLGEIEILSESNIGPQRSVYLIAVVKVMQAKVDAEEYMAIRAIDMASSKFHRVSRWEAAELQHDSARYIDYAILTTHEQVKKELENERKNQLNNVAEPDKADAAAESVAAQHLKTAEQFIKDGKIDIARKWVIKAAIEFPNTDSGKKARAVLEMGKL